MNVQIDVSDTVIDTPRCILRPWEETDLADFYEYASIEGVGEMAGWKHHRSMDESNDILQSFIAEKNVFALELKSNRKVIGSLGLHGSWANGDERYKELKVKEIGYVLSKAYWGRGLMPEAVRAVIDYCFQTLGLDALTVGHFAQNLQSKRVIEKSGFTFVDQTEVQVEKLGKTLLENRYILFRKS